MARDLALEALGERERAPRALVREQNHELVAADPVRGVGRAHRRAEAFADRADALVAGLVAERVVDLLQPVEIEHHEAEAGAGARAARDLALEILVERTVVAEAGEAVGERGLLEACVFRLTRALDRRR